MDELLMCKNELFKSLKRRGHLLQENNELKKVNNELMEEIERLEGELSDTTRLLDRTYSVGSNISDRTYSVGSELSDTTQGSEMELEELKVKFSLDESQPDYEENINLKITNKDTINDIKQNILQKISVNNLEVEQIVFLDKLGGVISGDNSNLFDLFKNGNVSVVVINKQHDFLSVSETKGGSYKRRKSKRKKSKRIKRKSKTRRRRR